MPEYGGVWRLVQSERRAFLHGNLGRVGAKLIDLNQSDASLCLNSFPWRKCNRYMASRPPFRASK
jgi:hypothetical protein